jgi:hypothetical protein
MKPQRQIERSTPKLGKGVRWSPGPVSGAKPESGSNNADGRATHGRPTPRIRRPLSDRQSQIALVALHGVTRRLRPGRRAWRRGSPEFVAFWLSDGRLLTGMNVIVWDVIDPTNRLILSRAQINPRRLAELDAPRDDHV